MVAVSLAYLIFIGILSDDGRYSLTETFLVGDFPEYTGAIPLFWYKIMVCIRDLFAADWISWPVFLWFGGMLLLAWRERTARIAADGRGARRTKPADERALPVSAVAGIVLLGFLSALLLAPLVQHPVWLPDQYLDYRYFVAALPLLLAMKGLFVEWLWRKSKWVGGASLAVLLFTSAGAAPFNVPGFDNLPTLGAHFYRFVREIHRPYASDVRQVTAYLRHHAERDDMVYTPSAGHRDTLTFYLGDKALFLRCAG